MPAGKSRDFTEAFHVLEVEEPETFVTVTGVDIIDPSAVTLGDVYFVPMSGTNSLNVLHHWPPNEKDLRFVNADWDEAIPAVGGRLESGQLYLFAAHIHAEDLPASFESIEVTYTHDGLAYATRTDLRVRLTHLRHCRVPASW